MEKNLLRILLADDDATDRLLFKTAFDETGLNIDLKMVNDGEQLMDYLKNTEDKLPHLLFLDLSMPCKGGVECLQEIRRNARYKDMAVAIYSASATEEDIEKTFIEGANVYIQKPMDIDVLGELLKKAVDAALTYQSPPFNKANFLMRL